MITSEKAFLRISNIQQKGHEYMDYTDKCTLGGLINLMIDHNLITSKYTKQRLNVRCKIYEYIDINPYRSKVIDKNY